MNVEDNLDIDKFYDFWQLSGCAVVLCHNVRHISKITTNGTIQKFLKHKTSKSKNRKNVIYHRHPSLNTSHYHLFPFVLWRFKGYPYPEQNNSILSYFQICVKVFFVCSNSNKASLIISISQSI